MANRYPQPLGTCLPIFICEGSGNTWFYAPGYLAVIPGDQVDPVRASLLSGPNPETPGPVGKLVQAAAAAIERIKPASFNPRCLTLYLNNRCSLACQYCFSALAHEQGAVLSLESILPAARVVARNCSQAGEPISVVFHGGGEPAFDWLHLERALDLVEGVAEEFELPVFRYIATNGVMPPDQAARMVNRFDVVGVSCDGPPEIHDRQRPMRGGGSSYAFAAQICRVIKDRGNTLQIRTTITPESVSVMDQVVEHLIEELGPSVIRIEPVYTRAAGKSDFEPEDADRFLEMFIRAKKIAVQAGALLETSGSRPQEIHGPFCHIARDVLNLLPGGAATACFLTSTEKETEARDLVIGSVDKAAGVWMGNPEHTAMLQSQITVPTSCQTCFNRFHCTWGCPDYCVLSRQDPSEGFRCKFQRRLALWMLEEQVRDLVENGHPGEIKGAEVIRW